MTGHNALHVHDPGFGPFCACGNRKHKTSRRCASCYQDTRPSALETVGRSESIITFARGDEIRTLHCHGTSSKGQIANGLARLPGDGWEVQSRSTPRSIYLDLQAETMTASQLDKRRSSFVQSEQA